MFPWLSFLSYAVVTAVTPGPNNLLSMSNAGQMGLKRSFPFNLGIWVGFSVVILVCTYFCNLLSGLVPRLKTPMLVLGALYMLYLAWDTFRYSGSLEEKHSQGRFASGLLLQFVNPKIYVYCLVSMEAYVLPYYQGQWLPLTGFALLLAFIGFAFTLCWALFGALFRSLFSKYIKVTRFVLAGLLVYCAVSLFF